MRIGSVSSAETRGAVKAVSPSAYVLLAAFVGAMAPLPAFAQAVSGIVVTASPIAGDPDRFATIVTQVKRDDIIQSGGANLSDALRNVPGVANTGYAAGASRPVIRGMDALRVATLENGLASSDVSEVGPDHGVPIDPLSAQDIEVVRGAATLRYGSQAIGGVVNAINNRVPRKLIEGAPTGEVSASYDSNSEALAGSAMADASAGNFAFHADVFGRSAGDYDTPDGAQDNSFFKGHGFSAGSSYFFGPQAVSRTGLAVVQYDARYGIPSDDTFIDMRQTKVVSGSAIHVSDGVFQTINIDAAYADYAHDEKAPAGDVLSTFKNREWNGRAEALFGEFGPFSATAFGLQYGKRNFAGGGEAVDFLLPTETKTQAAFAFAEAPIGTAAHLQGALRAEHVTVAGTPASSVATSVDFTPLSGSLGVLFDVGEALKLGLTATSAARAPGQVELYARGPHEGPATYETGDPLLAIERANSLEATLRLTQDRFHFEAALWGAHFNKYIFGALTGALCDEAGDCGNPPDADLKQMYYRQRDANFWGVEGHATFDLVDTPAGMLQAILLADYVRADFAEGGGPVPRIQPYRVGGGLNWRSDAVDAGFMIMHVGAQDHVPAGDSATASYFTLDAQAAWRPIATNSGFEVALVGHNLTDEQQRNAVSLNRDVVELPGRDVRVVLRQAF
jgi:iron complex outermembrane receptor protein